MILNHQRFEKSTTRLRFTGNTNLIKAHPEPTLDSTVRFHSGGETSVHVYTLTKQRKGGCGCREGTGNLIGIGIGIGANLIKADSNQHLIRQREKV